MGKHKTECYCSVANVGLYCSVTHTEYGCYCGKVIVFVELMYSMGRDVPKFTVICQALLDMCTLDTHILFDLIQ